MKNKVLFLLLILSRVVCASVLSEQIDQDLIDTKRVEKDFESSIKVKHYASAWVTSVATGLGMGVASVKLAHFMGLDCGNNVSLDMKLHLSKFLDAAETGVYAVDASDVTFLWLGVFLALARGVHFGGVYLSNKMLEQKVFEIGRKYKLSAEDCYRCLQNNNVFRSLFFQKNTRFIMKSFKPYYKNHKEFFVRYNLNV